MEKTEVLEKGVRVCGKYRIVQHVGSGAFGDVYEAYDGELGRSCALKIFRRDVAGVDQGQFEELRERWGKEAQIGAQFTEEEVVTVFQIHGQDEKEGPLILAMEYAGGGDLWDLIKEARESGKSIPIERSISIALNIAKGLSALHKKGVVHRDLSPKNILFDREGKKAKVADFGLAQLPPSDSGSMPSVLSRQHAQPGTPGFRTPEHDDPNVVYLPCASDVYQLGLLWFMMLTLKPYHEVKGSRVSEWRKDVPPKIDGLVLELLQEDRSKRPRDGEEVVKRILDACGESEKEKQPRRPVLQLPKLGRKREGLDAAPPDSEEELVEVPEGARRSPRTLAEALGPANNEHRSLLERVDQRVRDQIPEWVDRFLYDAEGGFPHWLTGKRPAAWLNSFFTHVDTDLAVSGVRSKMLYDDPAWFSELVTRFDAGIARVFILHGNIHDYVFHPNLGYLPLEQFLLEQFQERDEVYQYSLTRGLRRRSQSGAMETAESDASTPDSENLWLRIRRDLEQLDQIVRSPTINGTVILIEYLNKLFPAQARDLEREFFLEMILRWAISPEVLSSRNQIIMTTPTIEDVHQDLRDSYNKIDLLELPRPDHAARRKFLVALYAGHNCGLPLPGGGRGKESDVPITFGEGFSKTATVAIEELTNISSGLNRMGLQDLFLRSRLESSGQVTRDFVVRHKKDLLATESAGLLEVVEPRFGFEQVGGLKLIRNRLEAICAALQSSDELVRRTIPMGILFLGPPGTGKTLVAEALAQESGLNFVKLGNIRAMWLGQSERNLATALNLIASMEPVIVFVDEIDQSEGRRSEGGDSGVGGRIFSKLLEFMSNSDHRGRVLWIAASNKPQEIDAAMKRAGRFDLKLPFFMPEEQDRRHIFRVILDGKGIPFDPQLDFQSLAKATPFFSGAEIELVVNEALRVAIERAGGNQARVEAQDIFVVLNNYRRLLSEEELKQLERGILERDIPFKEFWPSWYRDEMDDEGIEAEYEDRADLDGAEQAAADAV